MGFVPDEKPAGRFVPDAPTPEPKGSMLWADVPGQALGNLPGSALKMGKDIVQGAYQAVRHPVQTVENISHIVGGVTGISPEQKSKDMWDATKQFFVDRYGGEEQLKKTLAEDPAGFIMDISTVLTGGGAAAAKAPGIVGKVGTAAKVAGEAINPLNATKAVTGPARAILSRTELPEKIMEGVMKYPVPMKGTKRSGMVETQFKYGLDPTKSDAVSKLQGIVTDMNMESSRLKALANNALGDIVSTKQIAGAVDDVIKKWSTSDQPEKYIKQLQSYKDGLISGNKEFMTVSELDTFVKNMQDILKPEFQRQLTINPTAKAEVVKQAQMAVHESAKKKLAELTGIADLNAEQSRLLGLKPYLERANNRIRNYNTFRLTDMLMTGPAGAAAYYASGSGYAAMGTIIAMKVLTHPATHAKIAMALKSGVITAEQAKALRNAATAARAASVAIEPSSTY
jgi:hypothetical protein